MRTKKRIFGIIIAAAAVIVIAVSVIIIFAAINSRNVGKISEKTSYVNEATTLLSDIEENTVLLLNNIYGDDYEEFGFKKSDFEHISIGGIIPEYNLTEGRLERTDRYICAVYSEEKVIAHVVSYYVDGVLESMISTEFVDVVRESAGNDPYIFVNDCNGVNVVYKTQHITARNYAYDEQLDSLEESFETIDITDYISDDSERISVGNVLITAPS